VNNDTQVTTGNIFDLTQSIADKVADLTGIDVLYYDSLIGAQTGDPASLIADPVNYITANPEEEIFIVFINIDSGCETIGTVDLESVGFGGNGGSGDFQTCDIANNNTEFITLSDYDYDLIAGYDDAQYMVVSYHLLEAKAIALPEAISSRLLAGQRIGWSDEREDTRRRVKSCQNRYA
jgi:hypothetical protein